MTQDDRARHMEACKELNEMYIQKNADYGNSYEDGFLSFGLVAPVSRIKEKTDRLVSLTNNKQIDQQLAQVLKKMNGLVLENLEKGVPISGIESAESIRIVEERNQMAKNLTIAMGGLLAEKVTDPNVKDESFQDTLMDLANYAILLKIYIDKKMEKESEELNQEESSEENED